MWSIAPSIGAAAAFSDGVTWAALPVLMSGVMPFIIFLASFYDQSAKWELRWYDYVCGFISLIALILWKITHQPALVVMFAIASDAFAMLPTLIKSWTHPETETPVAYLAATIASATSFFAIPVWKFTEYAFPTYLVVTALGLFLIITLKS
ncbi:unnamed protein product [Sphagnum jensenii]|uniref:Uncharacterized protein n=1 Tax=Sphagnum jensenii TaxID=128206 RepID=A0ABP0VDW6_9BRYO